MWTQFMDMYSGGGRKEKWEYIYIEAAEEEANVIFYNKFGHSPKRVTCPCCGYDYSTFEGETLEQVTAYNRECTYENNGYIEKPNEVSWMDYQTLEEYLTDKNILVIRSDEIKPEWREGGLPEEDYA